MSNEDTNLKKDGMFTNEDSNIFENNSDQQFSINKLDEGQNSVVVSNENVINPDSDDTISIKNEDIPNIKNIDTIDEEIPDLGLDTDNLEANSLEANEMENNEQGDLSHNKLDLDIFGEAVMEGNDVEEKINFESTQKRKVAKKKTNYAKLSGVMRSIIFIFFLIFGITFFYRAYFEGSISVEPTKIQKQSIEYYNTLVDAINEYFIIDAKVNYNPNLDEISINQIIDANDLNYVQKKELLESLVTKLSNQINTDYNQLMELRTKLTKSAYLPDDFTFMRNEEYDINTLENSLLSLESIKFGSAMNVFRYSSPFLSTLGRELKMASTDVQDNIGYILDRGEKDINLYLEKCYLNPYESDYDCNDIGDFDRYYGVINEDSSIDRNFFKNLIYYIDTKLEKGTIPNFSILFQGFDTKNDKMTFDVEINTFKQDEIELLKQGISNPHVFILNALVNNLKQSKFIIGDSIKIDSLDIVSKTIPYGTSEFLVNNSHKSFTVPISKSSEIDIYDFVEGE